MSQTKKIVVVGSANIDMIVKVPHIPSPGETVLGKEFFTVQGGKGANQAVAASRAGGDVVFMACVGNDDFGHQAVEAYKKEGIDTSFIKKTDKAATGVALINVASSGENSISVAPGANSFLLPEDIEEMINVIAEASVVLMQLEIPLETIEKVAEIALKHNVPVILNPAPARKLSSELLKKISILTPNEQEAQLLGDTDRPPKEIAARLTSFGLKTVIITLGKEGAIYSDDEGNITSVPGIKVEPIDTTAAGDTFNGYLACNIARGTSLKDAIALANKAAAISVTRPGAQPSIPYESETM